MEIRSTELYKSIGTWLEYYCEIQEQHLKKNEMFNTDFSMVTGDDSLRMNVYILRAFGTMHVPAMPWPK